MEEVLIRVLSLFLLVTFANGLQSPLACSTEGMECAYDENNLIDSVSQVYSDEECRQICEDKLDCDYITYFNASAKPFSNICLLFKNCEKVLFACTNCVTQNMDCFRTCGENLFGHMDENIIDMLAEKSELDCKNTCSKTDKCSFYTYYLEDDPLYHQLCILLTELLPPFEPSDSASTGPADCSSSECSFNVNGDSVMSLMVTEDQVDVTVNVSGSCELTILAVGGGGQGNGQGGGSGYLQYQKKRIDHFSGITSINAKAGSAAEASSVTYNGTIVLARANPGQEGDTGNGGGDGYSGGGQYDRYTGYNGGSDGSAGEGSLGGSGTGEDIKEYVFKTWTLTPGAGGRGRECGSYHCGGGGGGVLVDGAGPDTDQFKGQGYGGGGGGSGYDTGLPGIVLVEISSG